MQILSHNWKVFLNANDDSLSVSHHFESIRDDLPVFNSILNLKNKVKQQNEQNKFRLLILLLRSINVSFNIFMI